MTKTKAEQAADALDLNSPDHVAVEYDDGRVRTVDRVSAKSLLSKGVVKLHEPDKSEEPTEAPAVVLDGRAE
jgi:hypothetical protein